MTEAITLLIKLIFLFIGGVICAFVIIDINERRRIKEHKEFSSEAKSMIQEEFKRYGLPDPFEDENKKREIKNEESNSN